MNARTVLAIASSLAISAAACNSDPDLPGDGEGYVGSIITLNRAATESSAFSSVHVRATSDACGAVYSVSSKTVLHRRTSTAVVTAQPAEFDVGKSVRIWADGPVADSCPGQARAARIELQP